MRRISISLKDKIEIIDSVDNGVPYSLIAEKYGLKSSSNISMIYKRKDRYINARDDSCALYKRTVKPAKYEKIDKNLVNFIENCSNEGVSVDSTMLKEKALEIAKSINVTNLKSINGYIDKFKNRNKEFLENIPTTTTTGILSNRNEQHDEEGEHYTEKENNSYLSSFNANDVPSIKKHQILSSIDMLKLYAAQRPNKDYACNLLQIINNLEEEIYNEPI